MKKLTVVSILLLAGILLLVNVLSQRFFYRLDLTKGGQYTLSKATKDILKDLDSPVTVTAYFSEDLPPDLQNIRRDFQDMLVEYRNASKSMVDYEFIHPAGEEKEQEALENGVRPVMINVREKDQSSQKRAFLGAVLKMGDQKDVIPLVVSVTGMEYALSTGIKKMAAKDKPFVGIVQGHGEPPLQDLGQVIQSLSILYNVEPVSLAAEPGSLSRFRAIALLAPSDSIPPAELENLSHYLDAGGNLFIGINRVSGNLQTQSGEVVNTGLETWLQHRGITVEPSFILDAQCGTVTIQQQQGYFVINTPVEFPYLPLISQFSDHVITKGLEQIVLRFASPLSFTGTTGAFQPILSSSGRAATSPAPTVFDVLNKKWTAADFQQANIPIGGILDNLPGGGKMVVIGDGDFPVGQQGRGAAQDNVSLMVNSIDWLSDDTGLIELRTKGITTRPIKEEYLGEEAAGKRSLLKYLNFGLPILLVLLYGVIRSQQQRNRRMKRMQEKYS